MSVCVTYTDLILELSNARAHNGEKITCLPISAIVGVYLMLHAGLFFLVSLKWIISLK